MVYLFKFCLLILLIMNVHCFDDDNHDDHEVNLFEDEYVFNLTSSETYTMLFYMNS